MFITFEGIEGSGKSTQIRLLHETLQAAGHQVLLTREPGGCPVADRIRIILLDAANREMSPMTELMLYAAARAQHLTEVIKPALIAKKIVLCDRFSDATRAYQAFGRGLQRETVELLNRLACGDCAPDLTVLLDCDIKTGLGRARRRIEANSLGPREERFELESMPFHQRVRDGYLQLAAEEPERFVVVAAEGTPQEIAMKIQGQVIPRLEQL